MPIRKSSVGLVAAFCIILSNNFFTTHAQHSEGSRCTMNNGTTGICAQVKNCDWWITKMRNRQYPKDSDRCGFQGLEVIVCCPEHKPTEKPIILPDNEGKICTMETDGGPGVCTAIRKCEFRIEQVRQGKRFDTNAGRCSFDGITEIVCCPKNERAAPATRPQTLRPAEQACQEYQAIVTGKEGTDIDGHIIGGETAKPGEFPFMVALGYQTDEEDPSNVSYICGGSLITNQHVLTAAHCVMNVNNYRPIEVRLGSVSLIDSTEDVQTIQIAQIISHPSYRISRNYFDIAIIIMSGAVSFSNKTMPICLQTHPIPSLKSYLNLEMIATGWGVTDFNDDTPSENLQKTRKLSLVDRETCATQYRASNRIPNGVDDSLLCILDENPVNRSDACQGDSGGPLFLKSSVVSSLLGIVSFGQSCASSIPGIYTSVYFYLDWIEKTTWPSRQSFMT